jgi:hypothetical protein
MRYVLPTVLAAAVFVLSGCSGRLSQANVRDQISELGGSSLIPAEIDVQRIVIDSENRAIAETNVKMAFQFERDSGGEWRIAAARLGDRQWVDIRTLMAALDRQRSDDTASALRKLAEGVSEYRRQNGSLPDPDASLSDTLHPLFMDDIIRQDSWGQDIQYDVTPDGEFRLRSSGPDGTSGSGDDIVWAP